LKNLSSADHQKGLLMMKVPLSVGDAVDDDGVGRGLVEEHGAGFDEFGVDAVDVTGVNVLHERTGKAVFHAEQDADLLHA
jgi:predicted N-acetyltransferase YhbS